MPYSQLSHDAFITPSDAWIKKKQKGGVSNELVAFCKDGGGGTSGIYGEPSRDGVSILSYEV
jgi:hypothetical protein